MAAGGHQLWPCVRTFLKTIKLQRAQNANCTASRPNQQTLWKALQTNAARSYSRVKNVVPQKVVPHASARYFGLASSMFVVNAFFFSKQPTTVVDDNDDGPIDNIMTLVLRADKLYEKHEVEKLYEFLAQYSHVQSDAVQWRLARAACDLAKTFKDPKKKQEMFFEAYEYAKYALDLNDQNFACHKWFSIMLNYLGPYVGTRDSLKQAYVIKEHLEKAIELNPNDATSIHSLGYWCFVFADLAWYERKIASLLYEEPPTSTYPEALKLFLKAEEVDPGFYSMNLMMIGKTYQKLNNPKMAMLYLTRARDCEVKTADDQQAHKEAAYLLKAYKNVKSDEKSQGKSDDTTSRETSADDIKPSK